MAIIGLPIGLWSEATHAYSTGIRIMHVAVIDKGATCPCVAIACALYEHPLLICDLDFCVVSRVTCSIRHS